MRLYRFVVVVVVSLPPLQARGGLRKGFMDCMINKAMRCHWCWRAIVCMYHHTDDCSPSPKWQKGQSDNLLANLFDSVVDSMFDQVAWFQNMLCVQNT